MLTLPLGFFVFFLSSFLEKAFNTKFEYLIESTKKMADGDFDLNLNTNSKDEFGTLAESFNKLCMSLKIYREQQIETRRKVKQLANIPKENPNPVIRFNDKEVTIFINKAAKPIADHLELKVNTPLTKKTKDLILSNLNKEGEKFFEMSFNGRHYGIKIFKNDELQSTNFFGMDITEQRKVEQELIGARDKALEASKTKSQFLATMSHEIRTPMNGIIGLSNILMDTKLDDEQKDLMGSVLSSANSLLTIINDILDFSKIEAGKMTIENVNMNLESCVEDALELFQVSANDKGIKVLFDFEESIPKFIESDPVRIRQVLINLVGNAVKFTSIGDVSLHCHSTSTDEGFSLIQFDIKDSGIGIPKELQNRLFKDFSQVDASTTRKFGGTGLGLAICKRIVELLGGDIWVESKEGKGSTFSFTIAAKASLETSEQTSEAYEFSLDESFAKLFPLDIVVAEDNIVNQMVIKKYLNKLGYFEFRLAENGHEAVEEVRRKTCDIVFMDMQMPIMSGIEAAEEILNDLRITVKPEIIAMTANAMEEDRQACMNAGMVDFVPKPVKLNLIAKSMQKVFETKSKEAA
ncbi:MAG: ATP-binding protein [Bdellovibrionales bacterium]